MDQTLTGWKQLGDRRCIFLGCYRMMTANMMAAIEDGYFQDRKWVERLLHHFADYYFRGLQCNRRKNRAPAVWLQVHEATRSKKLHSLQYLLMGVNAHINYDLVLTLYDMLHPEWQELTSSRKELRYQDHCRVNDIISETIDKVQDDILCKEDPIMGWLDAGMGRLDEYLISRLITGWREEVWNHAQKLLAASNRMEYERLRKGFESDVIKTGARLSLGV
ncbi:hypothetical protein DDZ15_07125 [Rhodohalobacter mucosus]|uniref:Uncharacterized protein n=2 Tax=Rhodohalobacter mucosus TaxID=2079485 RepID=A0A316TWU6_9BACT|nr:hypothetical protein DDZ15_07125 [Rhodohalobacter mucosus]